MNTGPRAGRTKLTGLLEAGDPKGEVRMAWHAKELIRGLYDHTDPELAVAMVDRLGHDLQDESCPPEINQLGRTLVRWRDQIAAWHEAHVSNGPTEAANNLIKRVMNRPGFVGGSRPWKRGWSHGERTDAWCADDEAVLA